MARTCFMLTGSDSLNLQIPGWLCSSATAVSVQGEKMFFFHLFVGVRGEDTGIWEGKKNGQGNGKNNQIEKLGGWKAGEGPQNAVTVS